MPVYIVDKPLGLSSHDVVSKTRKLLKTRRVGHAGTLDPLATGVLVILVNEATKLSPFLTAADKHYLAWVSFGASTPTLDAEGPVEEIGKTSNLSVETIQAVLPPFLELSQQIPPQYSAIKKGGVKGYEAARKGEALAFETRPAGYIKIEMLEFAQSRADLPTAFTLTPNGSWKANKHGIKVTLPEPIGTFPTALFYVQVQAGTYIRAFARDLGESLGVPAHLSGLVRTRSGRSGLENAQQLEAIVNAEGVSAADALPYSLIEISDEDVARVRQGQRLGLECTGRVGLVSENNELVAVVESVDGRMKLLRVWPGSQGK